MKIAGRYKMDGIFCSLFIAVRSFLFRSDAKQEWRRDNSEDSEATVECAIHFVIAQQFSSRSAVTLGGGQGRNPRKGGDQILQRSVAESFMPKEQNAYNLKIWLSHG